MSPIRIWLNRNYATSVHVLRMLRENPDGTPVELFGSHIDPDSPVLAAVDHILSEPHQSSPTFVDELLQQCRLNDIDVFLPVAGQQAIAARRPEFEALGTALICPSAEAIEVLADKAATYSAVAGFAPRADAPRVDDLVPPWRVVTSVEELDRALVALADHVGDGSPLVIKPVSGSGADGVRLLETRPPSLSELLGPPTLSTGIDVVRAALARAGGSPPLMVMPFLAGPETSVDILARQGTVLAAVPRTKLGRRRLIGGDPFLPAAAAELVARFQLDGLLNVQFRVLDQRPMLLEINPRPSGGIYQSAMAGVNLPWAAVRVALGLPADLPAVELGATFVTVSSAVRIDPGSGDVSGSSTRTHFDRLGVVPRTRSITVLMEASTAASSPRYFQ